MSRDLGNAYRNISASVATPHIPSPVRFSLLQ